MKKFTLGMKFEDAIAQVEKYEKGHIDCGYYSIYIPAYWADHIELEFDENDICTMVDDEMFYWD
jgi:hypothetical protein